MGGLEAALLAERAAAVQRHLRRVHERLPGEPADLQPMSDATDAVILHLWQAIQIVIDVAVSACVRLGLGSPSSYGEAFRLLRAHRVIGDELTERLVRAAGFRNVLVHAYADLDLQLVHEAALHGAGDLTAFIAALVDHLQVTAAPEADTSE